MVVIAGRSPEVSMLRHQTKGTWVAGASLEFQRLRADLDNFVARDRACFVITREQVILP